MSLARKRSRQFRRGLSGGTEPWSQCQRCAWLRPHEPFADNLAVRRIRKLQVEPSLRCNLRCPACSNQIQTASRDRPHIMSVELFDRLLQSLHDELYSVEEVEYCGQGEPLLHPQFSHFVRRTREVFPSALQRVITNGNVDYAKATGRTGLDEIYVSCDGVRQASYAQYRIGGNVQRALQFMRDVPQIENGVRQRLIWKYILFEFNDSTEEIEMAQHLAQELGVDDLVFVQTHSQYRSERWAPSTSVEFPVLYSNVVSTVTPVQERDILELTPLDDWKEAKLSRKQALFSVDSITGYPGRLECKGWAWLACGIESIDIAIDGRSIGSLESGIARSDVPEVHPRVGSYSGFSGNITWGMPSSGVHRIDVILNAARGRPVHIRRRYRFDGGPRQS